MRASHDALVALDTFSGIPVGNFGRDTAFFEAGGTDGHGAIVAHGGNGDSVTFLRENRLHQFDSEFAHVRSEGFFRSVAGAGSGGDIDLFQAVKTNGNATS